MSKIKKKSIQTVFLFSICLLIIVILWGYTFFNLLKDRNNAVASWTNMQNNLVQGAGIATQEWIKSKMSSELDANLSSVEQQAFDRFIEPLRQKIKGDAFLTNKDILNYFESHNIPKNLKGKSLRQVYEIKKANGASQMESLLFGVENAVSGSSKFIWTANNGFEYVSWYSFKIGNNSYTVALSTSENVIYSNTNINSQTMIDLASASSITLFLLGMLYFVFSIFKKDAENISVLEQNLTEKNKELDDANRQLNIKLDTARNLSVRDQLTGLYNRIYFEEYLDNANKEENLPLSLIVGDINGLKLVNDALGHDSGDDLLKRISLILSASVNKYDFVARVGGDEFTIIMLKTPDDKAKIIIEKIQELCYKYTEKGIFTSISLGLSTKTSVQQDILMIYKSAEDRMYDNKLIDGKNVRTSIINSLRLTLEEKTNETKEHCLRMKSLSMRLGQLLNLNEQQLEELGLLAMLHDIGKISIPDTILGKPAKLVAEEWDIMKKHPEVGYRIASATPDLIPIADAILHHHERWDGGGYPHGLIGERIPMLSRIIAVIDAFDAMTHDASYHKAISQEEALNEIKLCSGTQFDPIFADLFFEMMKGKNM